MSSLPCLDEAAALPWVLGRMPQGFRPIVADNGSTDGSPEVAASFGARVVDVPQRGFGAAAHAGLLAADADSCAFSTPTGRSTRWSCRASPTRSTSGRADLVLGRRRPGQQGCLAMARAARQRRIGAPAATTAGVAIRDLGPMRCARRTALLALDLQDRRFGYPLEMVVAAARSGWRIAEVDTTYAPRAAGTRSKVTGTALGTLRTVRDMGRVLAQ